MNFDWLEDGRKIPDDVMYYIRVMAVTVRLAASSTRGFGVASIQLLPVYLASA